MKNEAEGDRSSPSRRDMVRPVLESDLVPGLETMRAFNP